MTISGKDWELLLREMDGDTSPAEQVALRERLPREPDLAETRAALAEVGRELGQVGLVDPPPELAEDVLRAIRRKAVGRSRGVLPWLAPLLARRPALVLASSLAAGFVGGLFVTGLLGEAPLPRVDEAWVSGTLRGGQWAELPVVDRLRLEGVGLHAEATSRRGRGLVVAELEVGPPGAAELVVEIDPATLRPRGFEAEGGPPAGGIVLKPDGLAVRQVPPGRYRLTLDVVGPDPGWLRVHLKTGAEGVDGRLWADRRSASEPRQ